MVSYSVSAVALILFYVQGTERKMGWPDGEEVISTILSLIARLELDRQDTIESLCQERVRVQQLGVAYDKECERRLDLLEVAVQKGKKQSPRVYNNTVYNVILVLFVFRA